MRENVSTLKAGVYWIGDLCYVLSEDWDDVMDLMYPSSNPNRHSVDGEHPWKGGKLWLHGTLYGDGCFEGTNGFNFGVDAGLIGVVPLHLVSEGARPELGSVVDFKEDFTVFYEDGVFQIGDIQIDTN